MSNHWSRFAAALALAALAPAAAACGNGVHVSVGDGDGVPLEELDMSGAAPTRLVLAGPDKVVMREGSKLDIAVSGDAQAREALRFALEDGTLGIMRQKNWSGPGKAVVTVTMPPARELVVAGSGDIEAPALVSEAEVNIAGSGNVAVARVAADRLEVNVMGSGTLSAAGEAEELDFNVAGSGMLAGRGLKVERANVKIAGSGGGKFASDGKVTARVAGSGEVTVHGRADCEIKAVGSGRLRCRETAPAGKAAGE